MVILYFLAGYVVTGLLMMMVGIILTWRWDLLDWASVRYCAEEGYMMLLYMPLILILYWGGRNKSLWKDVRPTRRAPVD